MKDTRNRLTWLIVSSTKQRYDAVAAEMNARISMPISFEDALKASIIFTIAFAVIFQNIVFQI